MYIRLVLIIQLHRPRHMFSFFTDLVLDLTMYDGKSHVLKCAFVGFLEKPKRFRNHS